METGLGLLGLSPDVFWRMTPREFDCVLRGRTGRSRSVAPPDRAGLAELMAAFPDQIE